jgi:hypothetical protein
MGGSFSHQLSLTNPTAGDDSDCASYSPTPLKNEVMT